MCKWPSRRLPGTAYASRSSGNLVKIGGMEFPEYAAHASHSRHRRLAAARDKSARTGSACACPSQKSAQSRCHPCTRSWHGRVDCGWTTTSTCDGCKSNSQHASITSKPLFISVAESMVIRFPIFQVGWFSACSGVTSASASFGVFRKGPPDAVRISFATCSRCPPAGTGGRRCARCRPGSARRRLPDRLHHQFAAGDQHFLVGQSDPLSARIASYVASKPGDADDGRNDGVHLGMVAAATSSAAFPRLAAPAIRARASQLRAACSVDARRLSWCNSDQFGRNSRIWRASKSVLPPAASVVHLKSVGDFAEPHPGFGTDGPGRAEDGEVRHERVSGDA